MLLKINLLMKLKTALKKSSLPMLDKELSAFHFSIQPCAFSLLRPCVPAGGWGVAEHFYKFTDIQN
jgi:hypothetical protein